MADDVIFWDWNGTLIEDVTASLEALNRVLGERGIPPIGLTDYRARFAFPVGAFYESLGLATSGPDWDRICVDYHRYFAAGPQRVTDAARAAVARARERGFRQVILSALRQDLLERDVAAYGFGGCFERLCGSDNLAGAGKVACGRALAATFGAGARLHVIGDTIHDADVARAIGADCTLVACGHQSAARLATTGVPVVADPLAAVVKICAETGRGGLAQPTGL